MQMGLVDRALVELREAADRAPGNAAHQSNLGLALASATRFEEAAGAYERALEITPNDARVLVNLAVALSQLGANARALDLLERAGELRPDDVVVGRVREEVLSGLSP